MNNNKKIGDFGENIASKYLVKNGFSILERNFRIGHDELDIIVKDPDGTLSFVEVKTRRSANHFIEFTPEDNMTPLKIKRLTRICEKFANSHPWLIDDLAGWRMDFIGIVISGKKVMLRHYKNI